MKSKILIIDDDQKLNERLTRYLPQFGFDVISATHPAEGLRLLKLEMPELVILDLMLPEMDGFEVCRRIREDHSTPIIMLTARGEVTDRIVGLELGADDYVPKPFEPRELVARIKTVLRRSCETVKKEIMNFGPLSIDFQKHLVSLDGERLDLTSAEFEILALFMKKAGKVFTRDAILDQVRGIEWETFNRSIDVLISRLRQKLQDDPRNPRFIKTVWGTGYMFVGDQTDED